MLQKSLGLIEVQGLTAAIEAADAALKSANVELAGYEMAKGGGWTTIKVLGDVGAVQAAVSAAQSSAAKVGKVISVKVIPRPSAGIELMVFNKDTVGTAAKVEEKPALEAVEPPVQVVSLEETIVTEEVEQPTEEAPQEPAPSETLMENSVVELEALPTEEIEAEITEEVTDETKNPPYNPNEKRRSRGNKR